MSADVNEKRGRRRRRTEEELAAEAAAAVDAEEMDDEDDDEGVNERAITAPKGRPTVGRRNRQEAEEPEGNLVTRPANAVRDYLDGVRGELEKVSWPTRTEIARLIRIVIAVVISASIVLGLIALAFTTLFATGLENPIVFVVFFIVVGIATFVVYRNLQKQNDTDNYNYPNRL